MTKGSMPPVERPKPRRQQGEQEHLREDAGMAQEGLGAGQEPVEHLQENAGESERKADDKSLIDKARDMLTGQ
jgi:hypothetical protein